MYKVPISWRLLKNIFQLPSLSESELLSELEPELEELLLDELPLVELLSDNLEDFGSVPSKTSR